MGPLMQPTTLLRQNTGCIDHSVPYLLQTFTSLPLLTSSQWEAHLSLLHAQPGPTSVVKGASSPVSWFWTQFSRPQHWGEEANNNEPTLMYLYWQSTGTGEEQQAACNPGCPQTPAGSCCYSNPQALLLTPSKFLPVIFLGGAHAREHCTPLCWHVIKI